MTAIFAVRTESPNGVPPAFRCERSILPDTDKNSALLNGRFVPDFAGIQDRWTVTSMRSMVVSPRALARVRIWAESMRARVAQAE
jgi:hypothetical protein